MSWYLVNLTQQGVMGHWTVKYFFLVSKHDILFKTLGNLINIDLVMASVYTFPQKMSIYRTGNLVNHSLERA